MKPTASGKKTSKSSGSSTNRTGTRRLRISSPDLRYVVCVKSGGHVDLELLKVYRVRRDAATAAMGLLRIVDNSGEDYLYPRDYFLPIQATSRLFAKVESQ